MGRSAAGVRGMRLRAGDEVVSCDVAREGVDLLIVTDAGYGKRTKLDHFNAQTEAARASGASSSPSAAERSSRRSWRRSRTRSSSSHRLGS